jgi:hypothetical protein
MGLLFSAAIVELTETEHIAANTAVFKNVVRFISFSSGWFHLKTTAFFI